MVPVRDYRDANSALDGMDRWREGRRKFGNEWCGRHPLLELYEELLDARNYVKVLGNSYQGLGRLEGEIQSCAAEVAHHIRMMATGGYDLEKWEGEIPRNMMGEDGNT